MIASTHAVASSFLERHAAHQRALQAFADDAAQRRHTFEETAKQAAIQVEGFRRMVSRFAECRRLDDEAREAINAALVKSVDVKALRAFLYRPRQES